MEAQHVKGPGVDCEDGKPAKKKKKKIDFMVWFSLVEPDSFRMEMFT